MDDDEEEDPPNRYRRCGVEHCNIQMRDKTSYRVDQHFDLAVRFLREMYLEKRSSCLVVCGAGVSRAPTIAAAFLCDLFGIQVDHALAIIRSSRPQIRPNDAFLLHLLRCYSPQLLPPEET
jgi:protein-tyrosine phosphatase